MKIAGLLVLFAASVCPADITVIVSNVTVEVGQDAVITCSYRSTSKNGATITWSAVNSDGTTQRLYVFSEDDPGSSYPDQGAPSRTPALTVNDEGSLVIGQTTVGDNKVYGKLNCGVSLGSDGVQSTDATFVAAVLPREDAIMQINDYDPGKSGFDVSEGSTNVGSCKSSRSFPPASITFYKNGAPLPEAAPIIEGLGDMFLDDSLTSETDDGVSVTTTKDLMRTIDISDHQADYICNVKTVYGDKVFEKNYTMPKFNVNYLTTMASFESSPLAFLGETINLKCNADGFPEPTISINDQEGTELTVDVNEDVDGKQYICKAYNNEVKRDNPVSSEPYTMDVLSLTQPSFAGINGSAAEYRLGDSISIKCNSDGNPSPTLRWYKGDEMASKSDTLSISSASLEDTGDYECRGTNGHENLAKSTPIKIEVKGVSLIGDEEVEVVGKKDESVSLVCTVKANPTPTFSWSGHEEATDTKTGGYEYSSQIEVGPLTPELSQKEYTCTATSDDGTKVTKKFTLPEIAQDVEAVVTKASTDDQTKEIIAASSSTAIIIVILVLILVIAVVLAVLYNKGIICKKSEEKGDESAEGDLEGGMNNEEDPEAGNGSATRPAEDNESQPLANNPEEEKLMGEED